MYLGCLTDAHILTKHFAHTPSLSICHVSSQKLTVLKISCYKALNHVPYTNKTN